MTNLNGHATPQSYQIGPEQCLMAMLFAFASPEPIVSIAADPKTGIAEVTIPKDLIAHFAIHKYRPRLAAAPGEDPRNPSKLLLRVDRLPTAGGLVIPENMVPHLRPDPRLGVELCALLGISAEEPPAAA